MLFVFLPFCCFCFRHFFFSNLLYYYFVTITTNLLYYYFITITIISTNRPIHFFTMLWYSIEVSYWLILLLLLLIFISCLFTSLFFITISWLRINWLLLSNKTYCSESIFVIPYIFCLWIPLIYWRCSMVTYTFQQIKFRESFFHFLFNWKFSFSVDLYLMFIECIACILM